MMQLHALIKGRVQGVGFRYIVQDYAIQMGLTGTVKNLPDGSVELFAQGSKEKLEALLVKLKAQPGMGRVDSIQVNYTTPGSFFEAFRIVS